MKLAQASRKEARGGERTGGVLAALDEIEIAAEKGVDGGVGTKHRANKVFLDVGLVLPGLEVHVE